MSGQKLCKLPHDTTLANLLKKLEPEGFYKVRYSVINEILRSKSLVKFRLLDKFNLIAIDGTGWYVFSGRHCPHCLVRKVKGKKGKKRVIYSHSVVDAKIVTPNGFALIIDTEFVENSGPWVRSQDCELKAAYRLLERLGRRFSAIRDLFGFR